MRQIQQEPDQTEHLRDLSRTLGLSEQTLERAIKVSKQHRDAKQNANSPPAKRRTATD